MKWNKKKILVVGLTLAVVFSMVAISGYTITARAPRVALPNGAEASAEIKEGLGETGWAIESYAGHIALPNFGYVLEIK